GDDGGLDKKVFQEPGQVVRAGLGGRGEESVFEMRGDGVAGVEDLAAAGLFVALFGVEVAAAGGLAEGGRVEAMRARGLEGPVFEAVEEEIEGAEGGGFAFGEAGRGGGGGGGREDEARKVSTRKAHNGAMGSKGGVPLGEEE